MPLFRRFGRPGLLGAVARTAVVAGTATMTARAVNNGFNRRAATQSEADAYEQQQAAQQQPQGGVDTAPIQQQTPTLVDQLSQLTGMLEAGQLTQAEFDRAKQKVLTS